MARVRWNAATAAIALTAATAKTCLQLVAASNHRATLDELGVSFDGSSNTAVPVVVRILRQTTAGTASALTLTKGSPGDDETLQTTAQHTATVEPTPGDVLETFYVHPQGGRDWQAPFSKPFIIPGGTRLGIEVTAPATVNVRIAAKGDE